MKTEIVKVTSKEAIRKAIDVLNSCGIIIYPTETVYGIGADATNDNAVLKVIKAKNRSKEKKITIAFSDLKMARKYLIITKKAEKLVKAFMPGPLTLIVESKTKTTKNIGFRIPDNKFVLRLIKKLGKPITTTSANISDEPPLYKIKDIINIFDGEVDLILDAGNFKKIKPSTVYDAIENKILRKGSISEKQIKAALE